MAGRIIDEGIDVPQKVLNTYRDPVMEELKLTIIHEGACDCIVLDGLPVGPPHCSGFVIPLIARESCGVLGTMRETCITPIASYPMV